MSDKCPIKDPFILKRLDEIHPDWRNRADVTQKTKESIMRYLEEKYKEPLDELFEEGSITIRSIEKSIGRIRRKMGLVAKSTPKTSPKRARSVTEKKKIEISESLRLLQSKYPYFHKKIIDACKNCPEPIEKLVKACKIYPDQVDMINKSIQPLDYKLPHMGTFDEKQTKYLIADKEVIFRSIDNVSELASYYGYTSDYCLNMIMSDTYQKEDTSDDMPSDFI